MVAKQTEREQILAFGPKTTRIVRGELRTVPEDLRAKQGNYRFPEKRLEQIADYDRRNPRRRMRSHRFLYSPDRPTERRNAVLMFHSAE